MIRLANVEKSFHHEQVLQDISLEISAGERVSLIGAGGCGKTVILKIILGLLAPDTGEVEVMQVPVKDTDDQQWTEALKKIGIAFQQGGLFDFMTVRQNLLFAMHRMTDFTRERMEEKITFLLDKIKLSTASDMFPHELSGGMQRRVGIARALSTEPTVAIFDDPTAGLDPVTSTIIINMIHDLCSNPDSALLIATSNIETAIRFAHRTIVRQRRTGHRRRRLARTATARPRLGQALHQHPSYRHQPRSRPSTAFATGIHRPTLVMATAHAWLYSQRAAPFANPFVSGRSPPCPGFVEKGLRPFQTQLLREAFPPLVLSPCVSTSLSLEAGEVILLTMSHAEAFA